MRHHCHGYQFQAVDGALSPRPGEVTSHRCKSKKQHRRRQREADEGDDRASPAGAQQAEREAELAAGRPRQKLAQRRQLSEVLFIEPAAASDDFAVELAQMGDRPAE